eukprot:316198_1
MSPNICLVLYSIFNLVFGRQWKVSIIRGSGLWKPANDNQPIFRAYAIGQTATEMTRQKGPAYNDPGTSWSTGNNPNFVNNMDQYFDDVTDAVGAYESFQFKVTMYYSVCHRSSCCIDGRHFCLQSTTHDDFLGETANSTSLDTIILNTHCNCHGCWSSVYEKWIDLYRDNTYAGKILVGFYEWCEEQALFVAQCDNEAEYYISINNQQTWSLIGETNDWTQPFTYNIDKPTQHTIIKSICKDFGIVGGFISSVYYNNIAYNTYDNNQIWSIYTVSDSSLIYSNYIGSDSLYFVGANWIWDDQKYNLITFGFSFSDPHLTSIINDNPDSVAKIRVHCGESETAIYYISNDAGSSFSVIEAIPADLLKKKPTTLIFTPTTDTIIHFLCKKEEGIGIINNMFGASAGGFIGVVELANSRFPTSNPIGNSKFFIVNVFDNELVKVPKGSGAWGSKVSNHIDNNAQWVWNIPHTMNVITFLFHFDTIDVPVSAGSVDSLIQIINHQNTVNTHGKIREWMQIPIHIWILLLVICCGSIIISIYTIKQKNIYKQTI